MKCSHHVSEIKGEQLYCRQCGELLVDLKSERENEPDYEHLHRETGIHWSERERYGYVRSPRKVYELGDRMADGSDDQPYEPLEQED